MNTEVNAAPANLTDALSRYRTKPRVMSRIQLVWIALSVGLVLAAAVYRQATSSTVQYVTSEVTSGALTVSVTASGSLKPRNQVDIGTEVSGIVDRVYVDVNNHIRKGQLLATLDTTRLEAQLLQVEGAKAVAQARVGQAAARLKQAKAYEARLLRVRAISRNKLPSQQDLGLAEADVAREEAEAAAAHAAVAQAQATGETVRTDLSKSQILSPIDGVVLVRSIEPGQTVAASLQAPVLFVLAEDLRQMELHVSVDEADVAAVKIGQRASFIVDAFPDRTFDARITRIHVAPNNTHARTTLSELLANSTTSSEASVVTYETVLEVNNSDLLLRPGMTATAEIITGTLQGATLVSNAALSFTPERAQVPSADSDSERRSGMMALMPYLADRWKCPRDGGQSLGCVWVLEDGEPQLAVFKPGVTDRSMTEVLPLDQLPQWGSLARLRKDPVLLRALERKLTPGTQVIVGAVPTR
jgi:HlyD family secretion protein